MFENENVRVEDVMMMTDVNDGEKLKIDSDPLE
jgi:hypothetical protein